MARFETGNTLGTGRPKGARNVATRLLNELASEGIEDLLRVVKESAAKGDMRAASIVFARAWPSRRGNPIEIDLPAVDSAAGLVKAQAALVAAVAAGEVTTEEASSLSTLLENQRRAIETHDFARRLEALERGRSTNPTLSPGDLYR
jgi:thioredoxin-like negative regulator of GroEL